MTSSIPNRPFTRGSRGISSKNAVDSRRSNGGSSETNSLNVDMSKLDEIQNCSNKLSKLKKGALEMERRKWRNRRARFIRGVDGFWKTAILKHPEIARLTTAEDRKILQHLHDIRISKDGNGLDDDDNFFLEFEFAENEFFKNSKVRMVGSSSKGGCVKWKPNMKEKFLSQPNASWGDSDSPPLFSYSDVGIYLRQVWENPVSYFRTDENRRIGDYDSATGRDREEVGRLPQSANTLEPGRRKSRQRSDRATCLTPPQANQGSSLSVYREGGVSLPQVHGSNGCPPPLQPGRAVSSPPIHHNSYPLPAQSGTTVPPHPIHHNNSPSPLPVEPGSNVIAPPANQGCAFPVRGGTISPLSAQPVSPPPNHQGSSSSSSPNQQRERLSPLQSRPTKSPNQDPNQSTSSLDVQNRNKKRKRKADVGSFGTVFIPTVGTDSSNSSDSINEDEIVTEIRSKPDNFQGIKDCLLLLHEEIKKSNEERKKENEETNSILKTMPKETAKELRNVLAQLLGIPLPSSSTENGATSSSSP